MVRHIKKHPAKASSLILGSVGLVALWVFLFSGGYFSNPREVEAATNVIYLTSGTTWTVPADWNPANNSIEVIGGGGGGANGIGNTNAGSGGGGGGYSKINNLALTPGANVTVQVGTGGANGAAGANGTDTFFNGASCVGASACAKAGAGGDTAGSHVGGAGGAAASGVGSTKYSGGSGGNSSGGGSGGGGAAGPAGSGAVGGGTTGIANNGGGGGGGAAGGTAGGASLSTTNGAAGGNNYLGSGGGAAGSPGTNGGGGGGGNGNGGAGRAGGAGQSWDSTHGAGGGGGGSGDCNGCTTPASGSGGLYGAGGGGGGGGAVGRLGGTGAQGIIVITYTTGLYPGTPGTPTFSNIAQTSMRVNWSAALSALTYKVERCAGAGCTNFVQIASGVNALFFNDTGLTANTSYSYRVRGTNPDGDGVFSSVGSQTTVASPPGVPGTPTFSSVTSSGKRVNWTAGSGATSYKLERCTGAGCSSFSQIAGGVGNTYYDETGLWPSTSYSYRVRSTNSAGDSAYSGTATQSTAAGTPPPASSGVPLRGYAWSAPFIDADSDGVEDAGEGAGGPGWIDLNCINQNTCASISWGLSVASDGTVSGHAWSTHYGWISANAADLLACEAAPNNVAILSSTALTGWLRAIEGNTGQSGGWDGCIRLAGASPSYGVTKNAGGQFTGFAWGSTNIGWVDFQYASTSFSTCAPSTVYSCADSQTIVKTETLATCEPPTVTNTACVAPQFCSVGSPVCNWPPVQAVSSGAFSGYLQVRPTLVAKNTTSVVNWNLTNVTNCTVSGTNGQSWAQPDATTAFSSAALSCTRPAGSPGCSTLPINSQVIYTLSCTKLDSTIYTETATVGVTPGFEEVCQPGEIHVEGKCVKP
jgi:hypothetical protein